MSKAQTNISPDLFWHPYSASVDKDPIFDLYDRVKAQGATASNINFWFNAPSFSALMDNEVWLHYVLTIDDPEQTIGSAAASAGQIRAGFSSNTVGLAAKNDASQLDYATSFRCGNPLQRACQAINLTINGTQMTTEMSKLHDPFNRLYLSKDEADTVFSHSSGGGFDDGAHSGFFDGYAFDSAMEDDNNADVGQDLGATVAMTSNYLGLSSIQGRVSTLTPFAPESEYIQNKGFRKRLNYLNFKWRNYLGANGNGVAIDTSNVTASLGRYVQTIQIDVYEKLMISPFHMYDNRDIKMSIPNIHTMALDFQIHSNYIAMMFRTCNRIPTFTVNWYTAQMPELLIRWITPPGGFQIPKQITIPVSRIWTYTNSTVNNLSYNPLTFPPGIRKSIQTGFSISNLSLPAVPDLWIVLVRRRLSDWKIVYPDDYFFTIESMNLQIEASDLKFGNLQPIQMWNMYRRHLRLYPVARDSFESWYRWHMLVPFTGSDCGVIKGAGWENPVQLSLSNMNLASYHTMASQGFLTNSNNNQYDSPLFDPEHHRGIVDAVANFGIDIHVISVYDKYALTLTSDGSSELELLRVNAAGTSTAPAANMLGPAALSDIPI